MELRVGQRRNFHFKPNKDYKIEEILEPINIEFNWDKLTDICPNCKFEIKRITKHYIHRVEILVDVNAIENELTLNDIMVLGDTKDGRKMLITETKMLNDIFSESTNFKNMVQGG